jgi:HAE1 family hydrophobic/amphiphilic exporter-1
LSLSPALASILLKEEKPYKGWLGKVFGSFNKFMGKTTDSYMSFTNVVTRKIKRSVILIVIVTVAAAFFGKLVPGGFIPEEDMGYLFVNIQLPNAASLQRSNVIVKEIEDIVMEFSEVEYATTATGFSMLTGAMASNTGFMFIALKDWEERELTAKEFIDKKNHT